MAIVEPWERDDSPAIPAPPRAHDRAINPYQEGIVAGLLGAVVIAVWFFILDLATGRAFYTPSVLGTLLFRHGQTLDLASVRPSVEMVLMFTWVHALVFMILGAAAAQLIRLAERNPHFGFGMLLFFVFFEFGFLAAAMILAQPVLQVMTWPAILIGNVLAFAVMAFYLGRHHPFRKMWP